MSHIHKTSVSEKGLTAMIRRLARDCRPMQFLREYVQNGIEAIERTGKPGKLLIDVNWDYLDYGLTKTYKLSFTDTGDGMTGDEIAEYINKLSSSGQENVYENYGMGAKIASITRNECGIVYESWKSKVGCQALFRYDKGEDAFGLEQLEQPDGTFGYYQLIDDDMMPDLIRERSGHGTRVTLMGMRTDQDTMDVPPGGEGTREAWIYKYLNLRYFEIPENIEILVRIGYDRDRNDKKHNHLLSVKGQRSVLERHKSAGGNVALSDATVHWWLLNRDRQGHGRDVVKGHTGSLNQGEIFDLTDGRSNRAIDFGILFGAQDVVLYVEPNGNYVQNTTRTGLVKKDGNPLPWEKWADEFRDKMPTVLKKHVEDIMNATVSDSHEDTIRERLKNLRDFYKISRYRPTPRGAIELDADSLAETRTGSSVQGGEGGNSVGAAGTVPGDFKQLLTTLTKAGGTKGQEVKPDPFPKLTWVSVADGTRNPDDMEDRAGRFIEKDNLIQANKDFQGFKDVVQHFSKQWEHVPNASEIIADQVYEQFEQQLIEVVAGALSLKGRKFWTPTDFKQSISEEALTTAVMTRYFIVREVNRVLRSRLGKPDMAVA